MTQTEQHILAQGIELTFEAGEYLFRESQMADFTFFLKDGSVELCHDTPFLIEKQKCFFGLKELILEGLHPQSARVNSTSIVLVFEKELIKKLFEQNPDARRYLLQKMSHQFRVLRQDFE